MVSFIVTDQAVSVEEAATPRSDHREGIGDGPNTACFAPFLRLISDAIHKYQAEPRRSDNGGCPRQGTGITPTLSEPFCGHIQVAYAPSRIAT
jgi:hypothetical protein